MKKKTQNKCFKDLKYKHIANKRAILLFGLSYFVNYHYLVALIPFALLVAAETEMGREFWHMK